MRRIATSDSGRDEAERLAAIADYDLLNPEREAGFDYIVELAASMFDVPISVITIVTDDQQLYVARTGFEGDATPRADSFFGFALANATTLIVDDALCDPRLAGNPFVVGPPFVRFYAGAPLRVASGHIVGALCIMAPAPRPYDADLIRRLESLAKLVVDRLELRRSERKLQANEARLTQLAHYDQLTGLPNRARFHDKANRLLAADKAAAVLLFDLDGFKDVNDVLGHGVGDRLLAAVGERLRTETGGRYLLARLGGDEFAVMVSGEDDPGEAERIASNLRNCFRRSFMVEGVELHLDTSIGVAIAPDHGASAESLLMAADLALYRAKEQGGGTVGLFEPHLRRRVEARSQIQTELRQAFADDEFELFYQPQINLSSGRIVGAEALLRWRHPQYGLLAPAHFLEALDRMPLAAAVGSWVLHTALAQTAAWWRTGTPIRVGINLFAAQFRSGNLPERMAAELREHGLPPSLMEVELTETVVVKNGASVIAALESLKEQGLSIALDDFGTGFASLSLLKSLPVTRLKIDKSFVDEIAPGACDPVVVEAILRFGQSFRLGVIAEGVETPAQEKWLREAGCHEAQGYLYGKPMSSEALTRMISGGAAPRQCEPTRAGKKT